MEQTFIRPFFEYMTVDVVLILLLFLKYSSNFEDITNFSVYMFCSDCLFNKHLRYLMKGLSNCFFIVLHLGWIFSKRRDIPAVLLIFFLTKFP